MSLCGGGFLLEWPLVCHHVTSRVMSLHPVRLHCIVLHGGNKRVNVKERGHTLVYQR